MRNKSRRQTDVSTQLFEYWFQDDYKLQNSGCFSRILFTHAAMVFDSGKV